MRCTDITGLRRSRELLGIERHRVLLTLLTGTMRTNALLSSGLLANVMPASALLTNALLANALLASIILSSGLLVTRLLGSTVLGTRASNVVAGLLMPSARRARIPWPAASRVAVPIVHVRFRNWRKVGACLRC